MAQSSFFDTGFDSVPDDFDDGGDGSRQPQRFWLGVEDTAKVVFLDDDPAVFKEHQINLQGNWFNFFTCAKQAGKDCYLCEQGDSPYLVGMFTIVNFSVDFTTQDGTHVTQQKQLLPAKARSLKLFERKKDQYDGLTGKKFSVFRTEGTVANIGDDWDLVGDYDLDSLEDSDPFDYQDIFEPLDRDEMEAETLGWESQDEDGSSSDEEVVGGVNY